MKSKDAMPRLQKMVATKTFFDSHINDAVDEFRMLSVYFAIISEFDKEGEVRSSWEKNAVGYRERFQQSAHEVRKGRRKSICRCKHNRTGDLENLIRGESTRLSVAVKKKIFSGANYVTDRYLCSRLKIANAKALISGTASETTFSESTDQLFHASEIIACFSELLVTRPEFVDWDDVDYKGHSYTMKDIGVESQGCYCRRQL